MSRIATLQAIDDLRKLEPNWDSYGAVVIEQKCIDAAKLFVNDLVSMSLPQVVPTNIGGVQLEWHENGLDIECSIEPEE